MLTMITDDHLNAWDDYPNGSGLWLMVHGSRLMTHGQGDRPVPGAWRRAGPGPGHARPMPGHAGRGQARPCRARPDTRFLYLQKDSYISRRILISLQYCPQEDSYISRGGSRRFLLSPGGFFCLYSSLARRILLSPGVVSCISRRILVSLAVLFLN